MHERGVSGGIGGLAGGVGFGGRPGFIASEPARVTVKVDEQTLKGVPDLYVLAVGVDEYDDSALKLKYAVKDAVTLVH
jgi:hypothetical protein